MRSRRGFARAARAAGLLLLLAGCGTVTPPRVDTGPAAPEAHTLARAASFAELPGWPEDDFSAAFPAFLRSCLALQKQPVWTRVCALARSEQPDTPGAMRAFFEKYLRPWRLVTTDGSESGLVTGYYEPLLNASRTPDTRFRYPLYAPPEDLLTVELAELFPELAGKRVRARVVGHKVVPYATRAEIEAGAAPLTGKEIAWVDDPVELFFLQIQGSGRLRLPDGALLRVGYADQNGHPYRSVGKLLVERGELTLDQASMQGIKAWGARHPEQLPDLLAANPSYVFFRPLANGDDGPPGALGLALTAERSVAVDAREIPLGVPLYLATTRPLSAAPLERLVLAQDTGGAIRGPLRVDFFWGFGPNAASEAGRMRQRGSLWLLWPADAKPALAR